jgi:hypothetical protein
MSIRAVPHHQFVKLRTKNVHTEGPSTDVTRTWFLERVQLTVKRYRTTRFTDSLRDRPQCSRTRSVLVKRSRSRSSVARSRSRSSVAALIAALYCAVPLHSVALRLPCRSCGSTACGSTPADQHLRLNTCGSHMQRGSRFRALSASTFLPASMPVITATL